MVLLGERSVNASAEMRAGSSTGRLRPDAGSSVARAACLYCWKPVLKRAQSHSTGLDAWSMGRAPRGAYLCTLIRDSRQPQPAGRPACVWARP